jgi:hypothetical protein
LVCGSLLATAIAQAQSIPGGDWAPAAGAAGDNTYQGFIDQPTASGTISAGASFVVRPARVATSARPGATVAILAVSTTVVAAIALERMDARLRNDVHPGWPASGCLNARAESLGAQDVVGQASLRNDVGGIHGVVDLDNVEPNTRYIAWIAQIDNWSLCDPSPLLLRIQTSSRACTLADLEDPAALVTVHGVALMRADAHGTFHVDVPSKVPSGAKLSAPECGETDVRINRFCAMAGAIGPTTN